MEKITLSLLLALGLTSAYADGVYINAQYGISNNSANTFSASLGYNQSLSNNFFVNTNVVANYSRANFNVNYVDPSPGVISSSYDFSHALSIAWMIGAGYNFTNNLSLMVNAGLGGFSEIYTKKQSILTGHGEIQNLAIDYALSGSNYPVPFISTQLKYSLTEKLALIATYQYMFTQSTFITPSDNVILKNLGLNQLLAGIQFTF